MSWGNESKDNKGGAKSASPTPSLKKVKGEVVQPNEKIREGYTDDEVKTFLHKAKNRPKSSPICAGIVGFDGTGKSGLMLAARLLEEIAEGRKIVVFDFDNSCGPLVEEYFPNDDNIIIFDPTTMKDTGEVDYEATYYKTLSTIKYLLRNEDEENLAVVALDGVDTFLKNCENLMRERDLKITMDEHIKEQRMWAGRNRYFHNALLLMKKLRCRKFYITHMKEKKSYVNKKLLTTGYEPDWQSKTPGMMFQKIECVLKINGEIMKNPEKLNDIKPSDKVEIHAIIRKAKGKLHLENQDFLIAKFKGADSEWIGPEKLIRALEGKEDK